MRLYAVCMTSPVVYAVFDATAPEGVWLEVAELFVDAFTAEPYGEDAVELGTIIEWGPEQLGDRGGRLVTARRDERLVGFALAHGLDADPVWQGILSQLPASADARAALLHPDRAVVVHELAVREAERGRGIARTCLSELLRDRAESQTFIGVYERADEAAAMYRHWGLSKIGRVPMPGDAIALHVLTAPTRQLAERVRASPDRPGRD